MREIVVVCGPTASGKSALAMEIARERGGVVINADSMQIYDALPVLTAQPGAADRRAVPHALYGVLPPQDICSAARWREMAIAAIGEALAQEMLPVVTGGTGLYIKALMEGFSPMPPVPPEVRARALALQEEVGNPAFHGMLSRRDPEMAARLHPNDTQRLVRAWEVFEATGRSLSYWQSLPPEGPPAEWRFTVHAVMPERDELYARCDSRFDAMLTAGIISEAKGLEMAIAAGRVAPDAPVTNALGFHPLQAFIRGKCTIEQAAEQAKAETRHYAKRQVTWFRHQLPGVSFPADGV